MGKNKNSREKYDLLNAKEVWTAHIHIHIFLLHPENIEGYSEHGIGTQALSLVEVVLVSADLSAMLDQNRLFTQQTFIITCKMPSTTTGKSLHVSFQYSPSQFEHIFLTYCNI